MTEETKVGTTETPPVSEAKTEKVEKDVSYREILKTLDVGDDEKKILQEQYKAQLSSKVAENEIKPLKKDFYNQVTELRANKRAEAMFKEKLNKEDELLKEKGYKPLEAEEIKTLLDGKIFNVTADKELFEQAKTNGVMADMIRRTHSNFAGKMLASENNIADSNAAYFSLSMDTKEGELFVKYQTQIKDSSLSSKEAEEFRILKIKNAYKVGSISEAQAKNLIKKNENK